MVERDADLLHTEIVNSLPESLREAQLDQEEADDTDETTTTPLPLRITAVPRPPSPPHTARRPTGREATKVTALPEVATAVETIREVQKVMCSRI